MALVGPHVNRSHAKGSRPSMAAHIEVARLQAIEGGFRIRAVALFVGGPHNRTITLRPEERKELKGYLTRASADTKVRAIAHSTYTASPWRGDPSAAAFIREEAGVCQEAGIEGLVVHLPKLPVEQVMRYIARLHNPDAPTVKIFLEIPAIPKGSFYETPQKLAVLFRRIRAELDPGLAHFGLCVDSAHLWTCGVDIGSYEDAARWLTRLEAISEILPHESVIIHLNDSMKERGQGPDAHAPLMQGKIWEGYQNRVEESGLAAFLDYAQRHDSIVILERKGDESLLDDYHILRELLPASRV